MRFFDLIHTLRTYQGNKLRPCPCFGAEGSYELRYEKDNFVLYDLITNKVIGDLYCPDFDFSLKNCQLVVEWAFSYVHSYTDFLGSMDLYSNIVYLAIYGSHE